MRPEPVSAVVFDLGGVLIDWNPRYLYRSVFGDETVMEAFLADVCTADWNAEQDAGRPWVDGVSLLVTEHPHLRAEIEAFDRRWFEMLRGSIEGTVEILRDVKESGVPVYALTNWSAEKWSGTRERFPFLDWFDGVLVSGEHRLRKPDPAIFRLLLTRFGLEAQRTVFIDDHEPNVTTAARLGFVALRFIDPETLRRDLERLGVLDPVQGVTHGMAEAS